MKDKATMGWQCSNMLLLSLTIGAVLLEACVSSIMPAANPVMKKIVSYGLGQNYSCFGRGMAEESIQRCYHLLKRHRMWLISITFLIVLMCNKDSMHSLIEKSLKLIIMEIGWWSCNLSLCYSVDNEMLQSIDIDMYSIPRRIECRNWHGVKTKY